MRKILILPLLVLLLVIFGVFRKPQGLVSLAGSTAFAPFAEKLAQIYMEKNPGTEIEVQGGGSAMGIMVARDGVTDIGMVDLVELPGETNSLRKIVVAYDGIAVVVHPQNQVNDLSYSQLKKIFSGRIANWQDVGGADSPIRVISREEGSGTRKSFDTLVLVGDRLAQSAMFQDSNGTIREAVANDPDAVGYISISFINEKVKALSLAKVAAQNTNVMIRSYPLVRPIYFLTKAKISPASEKFINFVLSREGQSILEREGLIKAR